MTPTNSDLYLNNNQKGPDIMALRNRKEMDPEFQWRLSDIYPTMEAWETAYAQAKTQVEALSGLPGTLSRSKEDLKAGLDRIYAAAEPVERLYLYANLYKCGDNGDPDAQALEGRAMNLYVALSAALSFVDPEILTIPEETLRAWMADPMLADYRHIIEDTDRNRAHTLSAEQEKMLSLLSDAAGTPDNVFTMLESVDMTFPDIPGENGKPVPLTHGTFGLYRESRNRDLRREAFRAYHGEFRKYRNTFAAMYAGQVKLDTYYADVRGFGSALEKSLFAHNVPVSVYDSLVEAIHGGLPIMERYLKLRQKLLGLDHLEMYDLYCPMVEDVEYKIDYETSKAMVKKALSPLGAEYGKLADALSSVNGADLWISLTPAGYGELLPRKRLAGVHRAERAVSVPKAARFVAQKLTADTLVADSVETQGGFTVRKSLTAGGGKIVNTIDGKVPVSIGSGSGSVIFTDTFNQWHDLTSHKLPSSKNAMVDTLVTLKGDSGYGVASFPVPAGVSPKIGETNAMQLQSFISGNYDPFP